MSDLFEGKRPLSLTAVALAALLQATAPAAPATSPTAAPGAPNYADGAAWLCRPGRDDACAQEAPLRELTAGGPGQVLTFPAKADAAADCFYVYPTVSNDAGDLSDLTPGATEEIRALRSQALRFRSVCRLYAPMYRQTTLGALNRSLTGTPLSEDVFGRAYADVRDAWRHYLRHDNKGRPVILIGHSQGAIHLWRLIAEEIDAKPDQDKLALAILGGYLPTLPGEAGARFKSVPFCSAKGQAGCAYVWATYGAADAAPFRVFGRPSGPGLTAPCVNPAKPEGGSATLRASLPAPGQTPPALLDSVALSAACDTDAKGSVLKVSVNPVPYAAAVQAYLKQMQAIPGWGLHTLDMSLVQGDLLLRAEEAASARRKAKP